MTMDKRLKYIEEDLMDLFTPGADGVLGVAVIDPFVSNRKHQGIRIKLEDGNVIRIAVSIEEDKHDGGFFS